MNARRDQGGTGGDPEPDDEGADDGLDRAWDALESGDVELALELARGLPEDDVARGVLEASAHLELDDLPSARRALERACGHGSLLDDADLCWTGAELALREWDFEEAARLFRRTLELERTAPALGRLALCADAQGEFALADRYLREAEALDPEGWAFPPRLDEAELTEVLDEAIGQLEPDFQEALEETPILIEAMPVRELIDAGNPAETPPDMLGLFVGASQLERGGEGAELPASIHLFQRNLERACADREDLVHELRVTLYHEIGHMLGFDEEGVDRMGLA
jgi:predicted Zn-dependent protease with MMP-like domain